jgi:hypothetical protein
VQPNFKTPGPNGLVRELEVSLGKQVAHIPVAEGEAGIELDGVLKNRTREAVATVWHLGHLPTPTPSGIRRQQIDLRMPAYLMSSGELKSLRTMSRGRTVALRFFSASETRLYIIEDRYQIGDAVNHIMGATLIHRWINPIAMVLFFGFR